MRCLWSSIVIVLAFLGSSFANASEQCGIRYSVRVAQAGQTMATGSEIRTFSKCVSSLTYCHTHAEELAREHAVAALGEQGKVADVQEIDILDIETRQDCEEADE